jgi:nitrate/TMAO reductase-like tetraheme cytochrome c subunit
MRQIDTTEKFKARRMELAPNEWKQMKASGSRECFNCHNWDGMNAAKQRPRA